MDKHTLNGLSPETRKRILEGLKQHGIVNELEDLVTTLGGEQVKVVDMTVRHGGDAVAVGNAIHEKLLGRFHMARTNGGSCAGPDITGITPDGRVIEGDFIPAPRTKLTAAQLRSLMAFDPADWARGHNAPMQWVTVSAPCAGHSKQMASKRTSSADRVVFAHDITGLSGLAEKIAAMREPAAEDAPATTADERAAKRTFAKLTGNIQSIDQAELDQLLAPYIRYGLLRTIYTPVTRATEYRGPSGKLIAISLRGNHYRTRSTVLTPGQARLIRDLLPSARTAQIIPFPGGAA